MIALMWQNPSPAPEFGWVADEFAVLLQLVFVLGGILILAYLVLRFVVPKVFGVSVSSSGPIGVVARYPLEPRRNLYIIQVGAEMFLIGTSESNIQFLTPLDAERLTPLLQSVSSNEKAGGEFSRLLKGLKKLQRP